MQYKAILIFSLLITFSFPSLGQSDLPGRLFTTSIERQRIDIAKKREKLKPVFSEPTSQMPIVDQAIVDGYVIRGNGRTTTWINDIALDEISRGKTVRVFQQPGRAPAVSIQADSGKQIQVGVGDMLDIHSGVVRKIYESPPEVPPTVGVGKLK